MSQSEEPDDTVVSELMRQIEREQAEVERAGREAIAITCDQLTEMGITQVHIAYDGCGDSGAVETVVAFVGDKEIGLPKAVEDNLAEAAEKLLPFGWENNDGAFGEFVLDVAKRKLTREHNWRVSETEYDERDFYL